MWHVQHANSIYSPRPFGDFHLPVTQWVCLNGTALVNLPLLVKGTEERNQNALEVGFLAHSSSSLSLAQSVLLSDGTSGSEAWKLEGVQCQLISEGELYVVQRLFWRALELILGIM